MFFPERITGIQPSHRVLEVGPGATPHPRADVYLERQFDDEATGRAQRGYLDASTSISSKTVYYNGGAFPFRDHEFDYVICSHVLEHVPAAELDQFVSELTRVARRGYIEYPLVFYELICFVEPHLWFMGYSDNFVTFFDKRSFPVTRAHMMMREFFYTSQERLPSIYEKYKDFFFFGKEWQGEIKFKIVNRIDDLFDEPNWERLRQVFNPYKINVSDPVPELGNKEQVDPKSLIVRLKSIIREMIRI